MSEQVSLQAFIQWEEWLAMFQILFRSQNQEANKNIIKNLEFNPNINQIECVLHYLQNIVIVRSKNRLSLSLQYFTIFLQYYVDFSKKANQSQNEYNQKMVFSSLGLEIIRFTSQMADIQQNKKNVQSINQMLKQELQMRENEYISEVRHSLTHKHKPNNMVIEKSLHYLLEYLNEKYWLVQFVKLQNSNLILNHNLIDTYKALILKQKISKINKGTLYNDTNQQQQSSIAGTISIQNKQKQFTLQQLTSQNIYTFKAKIAKLVTELLNSENIHSFDNGDMKDLQRKKSHLAIYFSEICKQVLRDSFYQSSSFESSEQSKSLVLKNGEYILKLMICDRQFEKPLNRILQYPFIKFKIQRILSLLVLKPQLQQLCDSLEMLCPKLAKLEKDQETKQSGQEDESDGQQNGENKNIQGTEKQNSNTNKLYEKQESNSYIQARRKSSLMVITEQISDNSKILVPNQQNKKLNFQKSSSIYPIGYLMQKSLASLT